MRSLSLLAAAALAAIWFPERTVFGLPELSVEFSLAESTYRSSFKSQADPGEPASELQRFESRAVGLLREVLSDKLGFARFADGQRPLVLRITLDHEKQVNPNTQLIPTFFFLELRDDSLSRQLAPLPLAFRRHVDYDLPVDRDTFHEEVRGRFAASIDSEFERVVAYLSQISLARKVFLLVGGTSITCVFPFTFRDLKAGGGTCFRIHSRDTSGGFGAPRNYGARSFVPSSFPPAVPSEFLGGIPAEEDPFPEDSQWRHTPLSTLSARSGVVADVGIYITRYVHFPDAGVTLNDPGAFLERSLQ